MAGSGRRVRKISDASPTRTEPIRAADSDQSRRRRAMDREASRPLGADISAPGELPPAPTSMG